MRDHCIYSLPSLFPIYGYIMNSQNDQLPVDLIAQLVEYGHGHGFESCSSLNFVSGFLLVSAQVVHITR